MLDLGGAWRILHFPDRMQGSMGSMESRQAAVERELSLAGIQNRTFRQKPVEEIAKVTSRPKKYRVGSSFCAPPLASGQKYKITYVYEKNLRYEDMKLLF